ncbi:MAG: YraN family protein [Campylobacter sp.]|nr:YraN family protein [Campylobacter sp.]
MGLKEYIFGFKSESRACEFLQKNGYEIKDRNFSSKFGEIDIVACKGKIYHFIEVKSSSKNYEVEYKISPAKLSKILKTVEIYIAKFNIKNDFQIDAVFIKDDKIYHLQNITF